MGFKAGPSFSVLSCFFIREYKKMEGIPFVFYIGEQNENYVEQKSHFNYDLFLAHREEILARKDLTHQLWLMMKAG